MGHTFSIGMGRGQREVHYTEVIYFREFTIRGFTCSLGAANCCMIVLKWCMGRLLVHSSLAT